MTSPRLLFVSTSHFPPSEIQSVFRFFGKWLVNPNPCAITSPRGENSGLVLPGGLCLNRHLDRGPGPEDMLIPDRDGRIYYRCHRIRELVRQDTGIRFAGPVRARGPVLVIG